jgi:hypothetical protein
MTIDLAAIKARHAVTTKGPWELYCELNVRGDGRRGVVTSALSSNGSYYQNVANMTFIAAAHADIPALVAEVERLQRTLAETQAELDEVYESLSAANTTIEAYELRDKREAAEQ